MQLTDILSYQAHYTIEKQIQKQFFWIVFFCEKTSVLKKTVYYRFFFKMA